ncbi:MAG: Rieske (2Fe-2S) protein [Dehalococcoidia bacterium]
MAEFTKVAKTDELNSGMMKSVMAGGREILIARVEDRYYAAYNRCPHMHGDLSKGTLNGTVVTCPRHGSQFDLSSGQVIRWMKGGLISKVAGAIKRPTNIAVYRVKVEEDRVLVEI